MYICDFVYSMWIYSLKYLIVPKPSDPKVKIHESDHCVTFSEHDPLPVSI